MSRQVFYTGDVRRKDGSDTSGDGEPCLEGSGETWENGWIDPDWSMSTVYESHDGVRPDEYDPLVQPDPVAWLVDQVSQRIGRIEEPDHHRDGVNSNWYGLDSIEVSDTVSVRLCAHPEGFSQEELSRAAGLLQR